MNAILLSEENLPKIREAGAPVFEIENSYPVYIAAKAEYYLFKHFTFKGQYLGWTVLPEYALKKNFTYDNEKIKTDWDTVYRLEN